MWHYCCFILNYHLNRLNEMVVSQPSQITFRCINAQKRIQHQPAIKSKIQLNHCVECSELSLFIFDWVLVFPTFFTNQLFPIETTKTMTKKQIAKMAIWVNTLTLLNGIRHHLVPHLNVASAKLLLLIVTSTFLQCIRSLTSN